MKRSKWKGIFAKKKNVENLKTTQTKTTRNSYIIPKFLNQKFQVHNGIKFKTITVSEEMFGHKFGEFVKTRATFEYKKKKKKRK